MLTPTSGRLKATTPTIALVEPAAKETDVEADEALMIRFGQGDTAAFERLYTRHRQPLFRFVLRAVSDHGLAEELAQDVWIRLIDAKSRYSVKAKFSTWLYRIAHNRVIDHYRRKRPVPLSVVGEHLEPVAEEHFGEEIDQRQQLAQLRQAIAGLPLEQRTAFALRTEQDLSLEDIGKIVGAGRETVKTRLRYAMSKLREALNAASGETS